MTSRTVKVPFADIMGLVEDYLKDNHYVSNDEFLLYADLGLDVDEQDLVDVVVETQDLLEFKTTSIQEKDETNVVNFTR